MGLRFSWCQLQASWRPRHRQRAAAAISDAAAGSVRSSLSAMVVVIVVAGSVRSSLRLSAMVVVIVMAGSESVRSSLPSRIL